VVKLPIYSKENPDFTYRVELGGRLCAIRMTWNVRANAWYFTIQDDLGGRIDGVRVVSNFPLLRTHKGQIALIGDILVLSNADPVQDPEYDSFDSTHSLVYMTPAELRDWRALNGLG